MRNLLAPLQRSHRSGDIGKLLSRAHPETVILSLALLFVVLLMWLLVGNHFLQVGNLQSMAFQLPELGLLSLAMMVTMLTAGINLSIIATANLTGIVMALILTHNITDETSGGAAALIIVLAICAGLLTATLIGLLNGLLIAKVGVSPILATLGTMIFINGVAIALTRGYVISGLPEPVRFIGNGLVLDIIPMPLLIFIGGAAIMSLILQRSQLGLNIYMIGSNPIACYFAGINNTKVLLKTYLISSLYAGVAAIIMISRFNSAKADYGESYLLMTILASVMGGISALGGFGRVSGLIIALVILQIVASGLNLLQVSAFMTLAIWGVILIVVMVINYLYTNYRRRKQVT